MTLRLSAEDQWIMDLLGEERGGEHHGELHGESQSINEAIVLKKVRDTQIAPLIFSLLQKGEKKETLWSDRASPFLHNHSRRVSEALYQALEKEAVESTVRNEFYLREGRSLLALLESEKIPALALKGFFLSSVVYPSPSLRPASDIDFLIPEEKVKQAVDLLSAEGCRLKRRLRINPRLIRKRHALTLLTPENLPQAEIDLHWKLTPFQAFCIDPQELWERAERYSLSEFSFDSLALEDHIESAALEIFSNFLHAYAHLKYLLDLLFLIRKGGARLERAAVASRSRIHKTDRLLYFLFFAIEKFWPGRGASLLSFFAFSEKERRKSEACFFPGAFLGNRRGQRDLALRYRCQLKAFSLVHDPWAFAAEWLRFRILWESERITGRREP